MLNGKTCFIPRGPKPVTRLGITHHNTVHLGWAPDIMNSFRELKVLAVLRMLATNTLPLTVIEVYSNLSILVLSSSPGLNCFRAEAALFFMPPSQEVSEISVLLEGKPHQDLQICTRQVKMDLRAQLSLGNTWQQVEETT